MEIDTNSQLTSSFLGLTDFQNLSDLFNKKLPPHQNRRGFDSFKSLKDNSSRF